MTISTKIKSHQIGQDGSRSLADVISDIGSEDYDLELGKGTYAVSTDLTIPANVNVRFQKGAVIQIADGIVLTINGSLEAGLYQIFSGDGDIRFTAGFQLAIYPHWWGIDGVDDQVEINAALTAANDKYIKCVIPFQVYDISATVIVPKGANMVEMERYAHEISTSSAGGFLWSGGNNDIVVEVRLQSGNTYGSSVIGIPVINGNASTGLTAFKFYDEEGSAIDPEGGINYGYFLGQHLTASRCAIGFQLGDRTNDGWSTNFNNCIWEGLV